jgi:glutathione S-transferase
MLSHSNPSGAPILYSYRRCPYAIRARLAIKVSGVRVALREVVLRNKPAALLHASAKATVPVLQLPDGHVLEQSLEIMRWALEQHDPQRWLRLQDQEDALSLIALNDGPFKQALDRYKYASRHSERPMHAWRDEAVELMLAPLNTRLADRLCCGTRPRWLTWPSRRSFGSSLRSILAGSTRRRSSRCEHGWIASCPRSCSTR